VRESDWCNLTAVLQSSITGTFSLRPARVRRDNDAPRACDHAKRLLPGDKMPFIRQTFVRGIEPATLVDNRY